AALFYTTTYAVTLVGAFGVVGLVRRETGGDNFSDFSGLVSRSPLLAGCMAILMLSLAGIPPLAGFFGKFYLFSTALHASANHGLLWLVALALFGSFISLIDRHFRHLNAAALKDAAEAYIAHLDRGGKMMITLAGAMSTAELGVSLAEMIRRDKVHAITCTGANLEEDLFNLVARSQYVRLPNYRELSSQQEEELLRRHLNRVTDTCIP